MSTREAAQHLMSQSNARTHNRYFSSQNSHLSSFIITYDIEIQRAAQRNTRNFSVIFFSSRANFAAKKKVIFRGEKMMVK